MWLFVLVSVFAVTASQQVVDYSGQRRLSVFEQYCCQYGNRGKSFKVDSAGSKHSSIILCPSECPQSCFNFNSTLCVPPSNNCSAVLQKNPQASSGYHEISTGESKTISTVYCDMEGVNCDGEGGWMRVGYLNMTEPGATCPSGLYQQDYNNLDHPVCGRNTSLSTGGCATHVFSTLGVEYSKVCGRVRGYQKGSTDLYVHDAVIIRFNSSFNRIWTFIGGYHDSNCVCSTPFIYDNDNVVGNHFFCESGAAHGTSLDTLYADDPLWDGLQCTSGEASCCTFNNVPWFMRSYDLITDDDLSFQICLAESYANEDLPVDIVEIFIK